MHIRGSDVRGDTGQTSGMTRLEAISGKTCGSSKLWMGQTHVAPVTKSGDHHHGHAETAIYVVSGHPAFVFAEGGADGNSTALVGTPDTVAQALLDYVDLGVSTLLIRGYDPLEDATDYGRELIPLVRAEVARRDAAQTGAAGPGAEAELAGRP